MNDSTVPKHALINAAVGYGRSGPKEEERMLQKDGTTVRIEQAAWTLEYKSASGLWRFCFADGGILDWYVDKEGDLEVRGKTESASYQKLRPIAHGKAIKPRPTREDKDQQLTLLIKRLVELFPPQELPSVKGVGFGIKDTVLGYRVDFTDGGILLYEQSTKRLLIQGTSSFADSGQETRVVLEALLSRVWDGIDGLADTLKALFPDWRTGGEIAAGQDASLLQDEAQRWRDFWPKGYEERAAANKKAPCQRALMNDWAAVLAHRDRQRHLLAQAPTGLGKTVAALVPALAWVAQAPERRRIYYLVNRVTQHDNPIRELKSSLAAMFEAQTSQPLRVIDLVGRSWLCRQPKARPLPPLCKHSRQTALFDLLPTGVPSWQEVRDHLGEDRCAYHTLQGLMSEAHLVIADYWWLFSQMTQKNAWLVRAGFSPIDSIVIVDEAHNLPARVRGELDVDEAIARLRAEIERVSFEVQSCLMPIISAVQQVPAEMGISPSALLPRAGGESMVRDALKRLSSDEPEVGESRLLEQMLRFLLHSDEEVVIYRTEGGQMSRQERLVLRLVDPTPVLKRGYAAVHASLSMSGTLGAPTDDYRELRYQVPLFGLPPSETLTRTYASPFPSRNQRWFFNPDTYGTYRERANHLTRYAEHIVQVGKASHGVTAVFFSSYGFLAQVLSQMPDFERALIISEKQKQALAADSGVIKLEHYEKELRTLLQRHGRAYLFAIYQGKVAEGADFRGNLIKTVIGISIPLEYPTLYHQRLKALFEERCAPIAEELGDELRQKVREYTRERLSLSLVLQACGRGIRSEKDRCAFVLLDERYEEYNWRRFLESKPFNVPQTARAVASFHRRSQRADSERWDQVLLDACDKGEE